VVMMSNENLETLCRQLINNRNYIIATNRLMHFTLIEWLLILSLRPNDFCWNSSWDFNFLWLRRLFKYSKDSAFAPPTSPVSWILSALLKEIPLLRLVPLRIFISHALLAFLGSWKTHIKGFVWEKFFQHSLCSSLLSLWRLFTPWHCALLALVLLSRCSF